MEVQPPLYVQVDGQIGADELGLPFRDLIGEGVLATADLAVSQRAAGANMSVDVAAGAAWIKGDTDANAQPTYRVRNDATVNLAIAAADGANPRVDRVVAEVLDAGFTGTSKLWRLRVITGAPTAGATLSNLNGAAAVPATALLLANVLVPAAAASVQTANIDTALGSIRGRAMPVLSVPVLRASRTAALAIANVTETVVTYPTILDDPLNMLPAGGGAATFRTAGIYLVTTGIKWPANATGQRMVLHRGTTQPADVERDERAASGVVDGVNLYTRVLNAAVGATFEPRAFQSSGGSLNLVGAFLEIVYIGRIA